MVAVVFAMPGGGVYRNTREDKQARGRELAHRTRMSDGSAKRGTDRSDRDAQHASSGRPAAYKALRRVAKTPGQEGRRPALQRCARVRLAHAACLAPARPTDATKTLPARHGLSRIHGTRCMDIGYVWATVGVLGWRLAGVLGCLAVSHPVS